MFIQSAASFWKAVDHDWLVLAETGLVPEDLPHRRAAIADAQTFSTLTTQVLLDTYAAHGINQALAREVATVYSAEVFEQRLRYSAVELLLAEAAGWVNDGFRGHGLG